MEIDYKKISIFFVQLNKMIQNRLPREISYTNDELCDPISKELLQIILKFQGSNGLTKLSARHLTNLICSRYCRIRKHIHLMAMFGIVRVTSKRLPGKKKFGPWEIEVNPAVIDYLTLGRDLKAISRSEIIKYLAILGIDRLQIDEGNIQGFRNNCLFGDIEPIEKDEIDILDYIREAACDVAEEKKERQKHLLKWREFDEAFIQGAALVWRQSQAAFGYGDHEAPWCGDPSKLAPKMKQERQNLAKIFRQYGTQVAASAWVVFNRVAIERDSNDRIAFKPERAFQQYATPDKKPQQFVNHFANILGSLDFKVYVTAEWPKRSLALRPYFESIWEQGPEDGETISNKIGYELGSSGTSLSDLS